MTEATEFQVGDLVRIREWVADLPETGLVAGSEHLVRRIDSGSEVHLADCRGDLRFYRPSELELVSRSSRLASSTAQPDAAPSRREELAEKCLLTLLAGDDRDTAEAFAKAAFALADAFLAAAKGDQE